LTLEAEVEAVHRRAGLFERDDRGLVEITGSDARRWLNGMVTNDVTLLAEGPERSGCPALVLTNKGRVVADLQVLRVRAGFWLECGREAVADLLERLSRLVIADDVRLADRSHAMAQLGLEGPSARAVLARALGGPVLLAAHACTEATVVGVDVVIARFGSSGEDAFRLFAPCANARALRDRLLAEPEVSRCSAEALEVLRVEAGRPRLGAELSLDVLPPEARLEAAISYTKGCYIGQEIVARLRSRGHVNHLLVGLRIEGAALPARGAVLWADGTRIGEVTSSVRSPGAGPIALGFVRVGHDQPGTALVVDGAPARVVALPFVAASEPAP